MPKKIASTPKDSLALLQNWLEGAQEVTHHIGATRGLRAAYHREDRSPWPLEAQGILERDTPSIIEYLKNRHALDIRIPFERIAQTAMIWTAKRDTVVAFGKTKHPGSDAAAAAARELERFAEDGLPEQKRLNLDLRIAEGAIWRATFPLLAECFGEEHPFLIRSRLIRWALWVRESFAEVIREWPVPDANEILSGENEDHGPSGIWLESQERWELAVMAFPRYVPDTNETPTKLAVEEARRVGDLAVALPRIDSLDDELEAFVKEAVCRPQGNTQPSRTEHLLRAAGALEKLVGGRKGDTAALCPPPSYAAVATTTGARPPVPKQDWLRVTDGAALLRKDLPGLDLKKAKARVSWAAQVGKFQTNGKSRNERRIEPVNFNSWRLEQRDRDLDKEDREERSLRRSGNHCHSNRR